MDFLYGTITFLKQGGLHTGMVLINFAIGLGIAIERYSKLTSKFDVDGASFMNELQRYVLSNDIQGAIRLCSGTVALLPKVLKSGLKRAGGQLEDIQNAVDATTLEVVPKVEQRLSHLPLLANISTLLGLIGTIQGLIHTFQALSLADAENKANVLSAGIAEAMNTTFVGLVAAIILLILHAFLSGKADKITNEIDEYSVKLMDLLRTRNKKEYNAE